MESGMNRIGNSTPISFINIFQDPFSKGTLILTCIGSTLSICGALIIFLAYGIVKEARNDTRKMLLNLTIADFIMATSSMVGAIRYEIRYGNVDKIEIHCPETCDYLCLIHGMIQTWSNACSFFWTTFIALHLLSVVVCNRNGDYSWRGWIGFHLIAWGIPTVVVVSAASDGVIGEDYGVGSGLWCWITACLNSPLEQFIWMVVTSKGWEILMYFFTGTSYILLKVSVIRKRRLRPNLKFNDIAENLRQTDESYLTLWLIIYSLRIWGTIRFFVAFYKNYTDESLQDFDKFDAVFFHMQCVGDTLQAFFSCVLFCFIDRTVRQSLLYGRQRTGYEQLRSFI